ncbi:lipopolysaccharide assembly protein LapA domain-containing protein [Oceanobacter antarcticus]|jgi:uncharacterized integral membrane protein|uniref:LapA family protein n=1 Tax=Oceanobacter antarcticus TaxID=3133425 RepID=A0ABW8NLK8_9GAMM
MLQKIRIGISLISFLLIFLYCLTFATRNSEPLDVFFLVGDPVNLPVALWFGLILTLGCIIGLLAGVMSVLSKKRHIRRLQKALDEAQERSGRLP